MLKSTTAISSRTRIDNSVTTTATAQVNPTIVETTRLVSQNGGPEMGGPSNAPGSDVRRTSVSLLPARISGIKDQSVRMRMIASQRKALVTQMIQITRTIHGVRYFSNFQSNNSSQLVA